MGANMCSGSSVAAPEGRLALDETSKSLSRISGEVPTIVSEPPITMAMASGNRKRDRGKPVRELRREATGRYSAITDGFCMKDELRPATAEVNSNRRDSM